MQDMGWMQWVTFGIALVGATLGVFNAWWSVRKDLVRLRVRPVAMITDTGIASVGIEVINAGYIPVTISEVGFTSGRRAKHKAIITEDLFSRVRLPYRMEPRTEMTMTITPSFIKSPVQRRATHCFAKTACGVKVIARYQSV